MNGTDYDNMTNDYNNTLSLNNNCTDNENNIIIKNTMWSIIFMFDEFNDIYFT